MSADVQVFGRRHDKAIHALMRLATEKRLSGVTADIGKKRRK